MVLRKSLNLCLFLKANYWVGIKRWDWKVTKIHFRFTINHYSDVELQYFKIELCFTSASYFMFFQICWFVLLLTTWRRMIVSGKSMVLYFFSKFFQHFYWKIHNLAYQNSWNCRKESCCRDWWVVMNKNPPLKSVFWLKESSLQPFVFWILIFSSSSERTGKPALVFPCLTVFLSES